MSLLPAKDYSSQAGNYSEYIYSPVIPDPSAPELYPSQSKSYSSFSLKKENYGVPELSPEEEVEFASYVHIDPSELANYFPNIPPPGYPCQQHAPIQDHKFQLMSAEVPFVNINRHEILQKGKKILENLFEQVIYTAVEGCDSMDWFPAYLAGWIPFEIKSTASRRDRYLRGSEYNQFDATEKCIEHKSGVLAQFKISGLATIPFVGTLTGHYLNCWHQLRTVTLIAAINGHNVSQKDVQAKIFSCLLGGNAFKIIGLTTDTVIHQIAKKMVKQLGVDIFLSGDLPLNIIFNFFSNDAARVSGHAKIVFGGRRAIPVSKN